jgi:hypothetical protein
MLLMVGKVWGRWDMKEGRYEGMLRCVNHCPYFSMLFLS